MKVSRPPSLDQIRLGVIGLGYVGLPLAAEFAKNRGVQGLDVDATRVDQINAGFDATRELDAEEMAAAKGLRATTDIDDLADCNVYIITVPTPIDQRKRPDLRPLIAASEAVATVLNRGDIVIYESTVYPGATEEQCVPVLEQGSKLRFNQDFFAGYSPERINPGDREHRISSIMKVTSGSTPEVASLVDDLYASIISAGTHRAESIRVAEAAKVIENTQRDLNIALMNELSVLFERLGIDTLAVLRAAGTKWNFLPFRPGLVGGHCIGVDPYYLTDKAEQVGYIPQVILAGRRINDNMGRYVARVTIKKLIQRGVNITSARVGVLGLTFKENCPDLRNSKSVDIVRELQDFGVEVVAADPCAPSADIQRIYPEMPVGLIDAEHKVDALILAVAHATVAAQGPDALIAAIQPESGLLIDVKGVFSDEAVRQKGIGYWRL